MIKIQKAKLIKGALVEFKESWTLGSQSLSIMHVP